MHLTLKREATKPAARNFLQQQGRARNFLQQQGRFDQFTQIFNEERPHEGLNMRFPAELVRSLTEGLQRLGPTFDRLPPIPDLRSGHSRL